MIFHQVFNSKGNYHYNAYVYENLFVKPHFHKNLELVYVMAGEVSYSVGEKQATLKPGEFALILPNEVHSGWTEAYSQCWVGVFSGDFVHAFETQVRGKIGSDFMFTCEESVEDIFKKNLINQLDSSLRKWYKRKLMGSYIVQDQPPIFLLKACLYAVCSEYCRQIELKDQTEKSGLLMHAIADYIAQNYKNKITLSDVAEKLGYNYHYLSKCFHKIFNMSFAEFLNSYRLDAALALLTQTEMDITQIALESGFQSIRSFNDYFKAQIGTTPTKYRTEAAQKRDQTAIR